MCHYNKYGVMGAVATKPLVKTVCDAICTRHVGVEWVQPPAGLRRAVERFHDVETINNFTLHINRIMHHIVRKFLQAIPARYEPITLAIKTLLDVSQVSVEELITRLKEIYGGAPRSRWEWQWCGRSQAEPY